MKPTPNLARQAGAAVVEFALVALFFFTLVFTIMELARALYLWNTLQEVTRRAARVAAVTDPTNQSAIRQLKREAIFRTNSGLLALGSPITDEHIKIDYLSLPTDPSGTITPTEIPQGSLTCPGRNRSICMGDSGAANCVRLIRVRICERNSGGCTPVPYQAVLPFVTFPVDVPISTTIVKSESLGYSPGMPRCP